MVKEKASSYLLDQYKVMEGMEEQRKVLERKLPAILDIIQDAEEKGTFRPGVGAWLKDLKTAAYEANDVFDEFKYEAHAREAKKKGQNSKLGMEVVRNLFPAHSPIVFRYRMGKKLLRIVQTIEVLVTEMNTFGFRHLQQAPPSRQWREIDHIIDDSDKDIIRRSRDQEKKKIMRKLLDEASNMDLLVLPIVGPGDDFDVGTIASNISQTSEKGREKALKELQIIISGKRYLIVLDDVWNLDADKWGKLKTCLKQGGKGSSVLTTTRDSKLAEIMTTGVDEAYHIEKLSEEHLREIFQSRAFSLQNPNSNDLDGVVDGIVRRLCWISLGCQSLWLYVEYQDNFDDLPSHMKQCFSFCAIFPKDYEIDVEDLIQLWMAHDFILVQEDDQPETVGEQIFKELTWRSFFQDIKQTLPIGLFNGRLSLHTAFRKDTTPKMLRIVNYKGTSLPSWMIDLSLFQHLTELHLLGCMRCEEFPQFCHFKALEVLYLEKLDKLRSLASMPFPKLKELQLHDVVSLERWVATEGKEDELTFPVLEEVDVKNCPKLTNLPEAPKLKVVRLDESKALLSLAVVKSRHMSSLSILYMPIHDTGATPPQIDQNHESSLSELLLQGCNFFFSSSPSQPTFAVWTTCGSDDPKL
ncbi:putative disease resistance protein RGA4 [Dichanthelium oligosanthes]|uniref:Putative disease resistance protein RGA4 n=1 Tax=Dichanthelium oligosanthes TaxID=888268 RepID=A0A1E5V5C7_9POAL|nr:putative disease resistance protein RGA4 [Dichanthelium oligosanthes]